MPKKPSFSIRATGSANGTGLIGVIYNATIGDAATSFKTMFDSTYFARLVGDSSYPMTLSDAFIQRIADLETAKSELSTKVTNLETVNTELEATIAELQAEIAEGVSCGDY